MIVYILNISGLRGNETNKSGSAPTELHNMLFDSAVRMGKVQG